ncbi:16S rRNA (uracil(1498)-N(3))-methyltransferase [uncultured Amnibacterium sp.]|uniref:16S rRNA (uracil(1498)-N(3))-methyltransferase n=1 Tax=uncultured Amnibacterium sp. TaxID=1631851 RepID=UPI0035CAD1E9
MAHFYLSDSVTAAGLGDTVLLSGDEGRHASVVARMRVGESTTIGDGAGRVARAEATAVSKDAVQLRVVQVTEVAPPRPAVTLVQALAKGGRDELAVQAATELGVAAVAPWSAARSVTRWGGDRIARGEARWASILREAGKQAMRPWLPQALPLMDTAQIAALAADRQVADRPVRDHPVADRLVVVLDPDASRRLVDVVPTDLTADLVLVVGPEGGIAPEELALLQAAGAVPARLGPTVLRTSTAAPAALAALAVHLRLW